MFAPVLKKDVPDGAKGLTTTWAMKNKANGSYRARLNMRGFEQVDGMHYDSNDVSSPVVSDISMRVAMVMMLMMSATGWMVDINAAFFHGEFDTSEQMYC